MLVKGWVVTPTTVGPVDHVTLVPVILSCVLYSLLDYKLVVSDNSARPDVYC